MAHTLNGPNNFNPSVDLTSPSAERMRRNRKNHLYLPLAFAAGTALAVGGSAEAFTYFNESHPVDEVVVPVENGGSAIGAVKTGADLLANAHHLETQSVGSVVDAGQEVAGELTHGDHRAIQPGEQIVVRLNIDNAGHYSVSADPANLSTLETK